MRTIFNIVLGVAMALFFLVISINVVAQDNCESASLKLDGIRNAFVGKGEKQKLILIAHRGNKERKSSLNWRRLFAVKEYLVARGVPHEKIITAQAADLNETGMVEIYLEGQLNEIIYAKKNADIPVGSCDNDKEDKKRYQISKNIQQFLNLVIEKKLIID